MVSDIEWERLTRSVHGLSCPNCGNEFRIALRDYEFMGSEFKGYNNDSVCCLKCGSSSNLGYLRSRKQMGIQTKF